MAAARCSHCEIKYPSDLKRCHVCGADLDYRVTLSVDTDWRRRVEDAYANGDAPDTEAERIERWRLKTLLDAGYDVDDAVLLAPRWQGADPVDLHQAVELLEHGCPPAIATRILV